MTSAWPEKQSIGGHRNTEPEICQGSLLATRQGAGLTETQETGQAREGIPDKLCIGSTRKRKERRVSGGGRCKRREKRE